MVINLKLPFVRRSKYEELEELLKKCKQDRNQYRDKLEKMQTALNSEVEEHREDIQNITKQVNEVIGDLVNMKKKYKEKNALLGDVYRFEITVPEKLRQVFIGHESLLTQIVIERIEKKLKQ